MSSRKPVSCKSKKLLKDQGRTSRPPPRPSSTEFLARHAGESRAEALLARSFFERVTALLAGTSSGNL